MSADGSGVPGVTSDACRLEQAIRDLGNAAASARADAANLRRIGRLLVAGMTAWNFPGDGTFTATFDAADWQALITALGART